MGNCCSEPTALNRPDAKNDLVHAPIPEKITFKCKKDS